MCVNASDKQFVLGEIYDVDSKMLKRLDELEEHPTFYERTEEDVLFAPETAFKSGKTFEEVYINSIYTDNLIEICIGP